MKLLAVTTATPRFSAALHDGEVVRAVREHRDEMRHAERLFAMLDELLAEAETARDELTALACDVGPGSFTGVRVGLASCKGIAMALGLPLWPARSLDIMAAAALDIAPARARRMVSVLDAKRGEIFYGGVARDGSPSYPAGFAPAPRATEVLEEAIADPETWFCGQAGKGLVPEERRLCDPSCDLPHASWLAHLAKARGLDGAPPLALVEPVYLREPDAKKPTGMPKLFTKA